MGRRARGLEAAALIDRDVDEDGARFHQRELRARDHMWGTRPVHEHGADHEVDVGQPLLDPERGREAGVGPPTERDVELAEPIDVAVEHIHVGLHPERDEGRVHADHAAADDHHARRGHARHAAEQDPPAAERLLEHERACLRRDLARHLRHRCEQRQPPARVLDRLVRHADRPGGHQAERQLRIRGEVEVGEQRVPGLEQRDLLGLRLLDLDDQLGLSEHGLGVGHDPRPLLDVALVGDRRALAGLHDHLVARVGQLPHTGGRQRHPVLVDLDLAGNPDLHDATLPAAAARNNADTARGHGHQPHVAYRAARNLTITRG